MTHFKIPLNALVRLTPETQALGFPATGKVVKISTAETCAYTVLFLDGTLRKMHENQIAEVLK